MDTLSYPVDTPVKSSLIKLIEMERQPLQNVDDTITKFETFTYFCPSRLCFWNFSQDFITGISIMIFDPYLLTLGSQIHDYL